MNMETSEYFSVILVSIVTSYFEFTIIFITQSEYFYSISSKFASNNQRYSWVIQLAATGNIVYHLLYVAVKYLSLATINLVFKWINDNFRLWNWVNRLFFDGHGFFRVAIKWELAIVIMYAVYAWDNTYLITFVCFPLFSSWAFAILLTVVSTCVCMVVFSVMGISDCVAVVRWVRREDLLEAGDSSCVASGANSCIILICVLPGTLIVRFSWRVNERRCFISFSCTCFP